MIRQFSPKTLIRQIWVSTAELFDMDSALGKFIASINILNRYPTGV